MAKNREREKEGTRNGGPGAVNATATGEVGCRLYNQVGFLVGLSRRVLFLASRFVHSPLLGSALYISANPSPAINVGSVMADDGSSTETAGQYYPWALIRTGPSVEHLKFLAHFFLNSYKSFVEIKKRLFVTPVSRFPCEDLKSSRQCHV
ncbi:hypothetical protein BC827DRAFT_864114 [Russula dissimulans]|nr:hypothetical protein BC827DRAFT_864114 [Russula dissimulans]